MQMELGEGSDGFYEIYFGKKEKLLYLFKITSLDDLGQYENYRSSFEQIVDYMKNAHKNMEEDK